MSTIFTQLECYLYQMGGQIVQYVLIRRDLLKSLMWPVGAVIAQACHACTAAIHLFYDDPNTKDYLKDLDNMHKIILEVNIFSY